MKRLKANQSHGCAYCRQAGVKTPAIYRADGFHGLDRTACDAHREKLAEYEAGELERNARITEADYQTWWRL